MKRLLPLLEHVDIVQNGQEAVAREAANIRRDLVDMDMVMDGLEAPAPADFTRPRVELVGYCPQDLKGSWLRRLQRSCGALAPVCPETRRRLLHQVNHSCTDINEVKCP
jgi:hypothetical protein